MMIRVNAVIPSRIDGSTVSADISATIWSDSE